jgi:hypothetical protein
MKVRVETAARAANTGAPTLKKCIVAISALTVAIGVVEAAGLMDEQHARARAIKILMGDPYGTTIERVSSAIKDVKLIRNGKTACGVMHRPVWQIHVVVEKPVNNPDTPIDGHLSIDATNGKMLCANLPMLD